MGINMYKGMQRVGWKLDTQKFIDYLRKTHNVGKAFYFIGDSQDPDHIELHQSLNRQGYDLIKKPIMPGKTNSKIKGNCDGEMILHAMIQYNNYNKAIMVTSDGDFCCLAVYLRNNAKLGHIIVPRKTQASALLRIQVNKFLLSLNSLKSALEYIKK
jgi:uncharacterized LabA/DUF88 family protein